MRKLVTLLVLSLTVAACDKDTPLGNVPRLDATYEGTWALSWQTNNPVINPPGETYLCPGSISLDNDYRDAVNGSFLILDEGTA